MMDNLFPTKLAMALSKRDIVPAITVRLTPEENLWLRRHATVLGMDMTTLVRKSLALAVPQLMGIPFLRRVELDDTRTDPDCM